MNKLYEAVNANKLVDELQAVGMLEREAMSFFPTDTGLNIRFRDIKEIIIDVMVDEEPTGEVIVSYTKPVEHMLIETDEEGNETEKIYFVDEAFDPTQLLADIQAVVDVHDVIPYPSPNPNLTIQEQIDRLEMILLETEGVI